MTWPLHRLEDLTEPDRPITYGVVKPGPEDPVSGVKFIRGGDIFEGNLAIENLRTITPEISKSYSRTLLSGGELVVSLVGNPGHVAVVPKSLAGANLARQAGLVALRNEIDADFVKFFLMSPQGRAELFAQMTGSVQVVINLHNLRTVRVPLPSLPVQRQIAGILSAYDELMENNRRRIRLLEAMARALYREWFVRPCQAGKLPKGWETKKLGDLADIRWGDTSTTKASYVEEGFAAYSASGLDGKLDHFDFDRTGIVLSAIGAQCGKTWLARGKWSCIKNTIRFWSKDDSASTEYLFIATEGQDFWPRRGAAQPFISQGDSERKELVIPDGGTMGRFTAFATDALEQIAVLETQIQNLRRTRDLLLPRLLSGQVELSPAELEIKEHLQ